MSSKKFNGFENWIIKEALSLWTEEAEKQVQKTEDETGGRSIYAPGYFTMVTDELKEKVDNMTYKRDLK